MEFLITIVVMLLSFLAYFLPTFIAYKQDHKRMSSILILNILGGWTGILWLIALIWSLNKDW